MDRNKIAKEEAQRRFAAISECKRLAEQIPDQDALSAALLQQPDREKRYEMYRFLTPFLRFVPTFPEDVPKSDVIHQPQMIVRPN